MSSKLILCRFEPNRFPISEFMKDKQGNIVFPFIHIARQPIHFTNGQVVPPNYSPGYPRIPQGPPIIPAVIPSNYVPILPAMVEGFNIELEKYLEGHENVNLSELLDFGKSLDLEIKRLDLKSLVDINLGSIPKDLLNDPEGLLKYFSEDRFGEFDLGRFKIDDAKSRSGKGRVGGLGGSGGFGGGGGIG